MTGPVREYVQLRLDRTVRPEARSHKPTEKLTAMAACHTAYAAGVRLATSADNDPRVAALLIDGTSSADLGDLLTWEEECARRYLLPGTFDAELRRGVRDGLRAGTRHRIAGQLPLQLG